jgi:hypothetical protein
VISWLEKLLGGSTQPGPWYGGYHSAWSFAHPGMWESGQGRAGGWYCDTWATGTWEWDREWFRSSGMDEPRKVRIVDTSVKPGEVRLASRLAPGESMTFTIGTS